jgi:hypothetical protein
MDDTSVRVADSVTRFDIAILSERTLCRGRQIELWWHFVSDTQAPQNQDPEGSAFFSFRGPFGAGETFVNVFPLPFGPGAFFPYKRICGVRLKNDVPPNETLGFTLDRITVQSYEEPLFNIRLALLDGDELIGYFGDVACEIIGGEIDHLALFAPSLVRPEERFDCVVIARDADKNRTGRDIRDLTFEIMGSGIQYDAVAYDAARKRHTIKGCRVKCPGVHRIAMRTKDGRAKGRSHPIVARADVKKRVFWGDLHQHSYLWDGRGRPLANYQYGADVGCLDFGAVASHQAGMYLPPLNHLPKGACAAQQGWEEVVEAGTNAASESFVPFFGYEEAVRSGGGDYNVYFMNPKDQPVHVRLGGREPENMREFVSVLAASEGACLALPHAHAGGGPLQSEIPHVPDIIANLEICSAHGLFEHYLREWLDRGYKLGVHGGGDNHMTNMGNGNPGIAYVNTNGLAAAWATDRTREGIWEAIRSRHTYAATGNQRVFLDVSANGLPMGSVIRDNGVREFRIEYAGTAPWLRIEIIKNGRVVKAFQPPLEKRSGYRLMWVDNVWERRAYGSETTGRIGGAGGLDVALVQCCNFMNHTDTAFKDGHAVAFRTSAYSWTPRGVIVSPSSEMDSLEFSIRDQYFGRTILNADVRIPLMETNFEHWFLLNLTAEGMWPQIGLRIKEMGVTLSGCWVDDNWPENAVLEWRDDGGLKRDDYYYIRVEQVDGTKAWSSPMWFE